MSVQPDVRAQLRSLSISTDRRPATTGRARRWLVALAILVFFVGGLWLGFLAARTELPGKISVLAGVAPVAPQVELLTVTTKPQPQSAPVLTATGKIVSDHRVQVATKVSGQVVALFFEQGDRVEKGKLLARIEDVLYRARRDEAAARLERSKANLEFQKVNYERVASLMEGQSAPPIEYADAERWLQDAKAQLAADKASLDFTQKSLDDTEVTAPIAGVILGRNVEVGDFVSAEGGRGANANAQFATIADMTQLRVEVDISELDISRVHAGMPCAIIPDAYKDRKYRGQVMWLDPGANYSKATVQAKVRIEDPDDFLRVEGSAQVTFLLQASAAGAGTPTGIWIPAAACLFDDSGQTATVFVAVEGRWKRTPVKLGRRPGAEVEILSGLTAGQSIAASGADKLTDGQQIAR